MTLMARLIRNKIPFDAVKVLSSSNSTRQLIVMASLSCGFQMSCAAIGPDGDGGRDGGTVSPWGPGSGCVLGRATAQFRSQIAPPLIMRPGDRAQVSVTYDNCGGEAWTTGMFALVPTAQTRGTWGVSRVALPMDVMDGARVTVPFEIQAPNVGGTYEYSWAIARDGAEVHQEFTPVVTVLVQQSADCTAVGPIARFRAQVPPGPFVGVREAVRGTVTFANCGAETWSAARGFYLASALPMGQSPWRTTRVELPEDVAFGSEVTITVTGVAPEAPGRYGYSWAIQQQNERVGEPSPEVQITALTRANCAAAGPTARFVAQTAPTAMNARETADVSVTFANCGESVWNSEYRINAAAPALNGRWGAGNIVLPLAVGPGFSLAVPFRIQAPGDEGSIAYRWAVTRAETALAQPTPERTITVRSAAGPCQARPVVPGGLSDGFGPRFHPVYHEWRMHWGQDMNARWGQPIFACRAGVVVFAGPNGGFGNFTEIDHGGGMTTRYAHQCDGCIQVGVGARVSAGQQIGLVGSTGTSSGALMNFDV